MNITFPFFKKTASIILFCILAFGHHLSAQDNHYPPYDPDAPELLDIQKTIDEGMDDVENTLKKLKGFQPFAIVLLENDSIAEIRVQQEIKNNYSVSDLEEALSIDALKGRYKVVSIFYEDMGKNEGSGKGATVIVIHSEHTNDDFAYRFEFPYLTDAKRKITFEDPSVNFEEQVMFKP